MRRTRRAREAHGDEFDPGPVFRVAWRLFREDCGFSAHASSVAMAIAVRLPKGFGGEWTSVPERALSMGMAAILNAREIVLIATGVEKTGAVRGMIEQLITTRLPASLLQLHPRVTVMLDAAAAGTL